MSVAAYAYAPRSTARPGPPRLEVVTVRRPPPRRRDAAYVLCVASLLTIGVLGVLLLNTLMQQQADRMAAQRQRLGQLALQVESLSTAVDQQTDPRMLAERARALHMRPARRFEFLAVTPRGSRVSAPIPGAPTVRAG
jgi:hypothetical protein